MISVLRILFERYRISFAMKTFNYSVDKCIEKRSKISVLNSGFLIMITSYRN